MSIYIKEASTSPSSDIATASVDPSHLEHEGVKGEGTVGVTQTISSTRLVPDELESWTGAELQRGGVMGQ